MSMALGTESNRARARRILHECEKLYCSLSWAEGLVSPASVEEAEGTCRFGADPETSVLNVDCRAHEVNNLYVVDTSFSPSIGAVNPALTAMANALRVGDHLLERMGAQPAQREPARGDAGALGRR
jgi:choline dehydrogenase-like flavoprotein